MPFRTPLRPFRIRHSEPVVVYRIEHGDTHIGPYNHDYELGEHRDVAEFMRLVNDDGAGTHQPTARIDIPGLDKWLKPLNKKEPDYNPFYGEWLNLLHFKYVRFGFRHLAQLRAWFGDSFLPLAAEGYVIAKYEVAPEGVVDGYNQVAFHTLYAKRIGTVPFVDAMASVPTLPRLAEAA